MGKLLILFRRDYIFFFEEIENFLFKKLLIGSSGCPPDKAEATGN
jgi:hypothetical protein